VSSGKKATHAHHHHNNGAGHRSADEIAKERLAVKASCEKDLKESFNSYFGM